MDILTDQSFFRAFHILFGIAWIGLLYYFNFIQGEYVKVADPDAKADVFKKLEKPYFEFIYKEDTKDWFGEDFTLQDKIQKVGYEIFVDTMLSMEIKHVGIYAY